MSERLTLPVLPLREVVLFPGVSTPIGAGRPTTLRAIEAALAKRERLGASGREYVQRECAWPAFDARLEQLVDLVAA